MNPLIKLWGPLVGVFIIEHILLKYVYNRRSSLQRIFLDRNFTSQADVFYMFLYYTAYKYIRQAMLLLFLPGLVYIGLDWLRQHYNWTGFFGEYLPENPLLLFAIWLVAIDIPSYVAHVAMHKIPFLWRFHKLHHSATEMNIITGNRVTFGEHFINNIASLLILTVLLGITSPTAIASAMLVRHIIDLLQHSDLPWDYGPLGYIIASPRFHRLHHASEIEHFDKNFANVFSFLDYIFGTASNAYTLSPKIADDITLGLDTPEETKKYNSWTMALFGETWLHYGVLLMNSIKRSITKPDKSD